MQSGLWSNWRWVVENLRLDVVTLTRAVRFWGTERLWSLLYIFSVVHTPHEEMFPRITNEWGCSFLQTVNCIVKGWNFCGKWSPPLLKMLLSRIFLFLSENQNQPSNTWIVMKLSILFSFPLWRSVYVWTTPLSVLTASVLCATESLIFPQNPHLRWL